MKPSRHTLTRVPLALLLALLMVAALQVTAAHAWYFRGTWFSGDSWLGSSGGSYSMTFSEAAGHDGISVRHHYRRDNTWFATAWNYGYGDSISRSQIGRVDGRNCHGDHRVKVDGGWSSIHKSYC